MICTNCGLEKDLTHFRGIHKQCKDCLNKKTKLWMKDNKDKLKLTRKKYYEKRKVYILERNKKYRIFNIDKIKAYNRSSNRKAKMKEYYVNNNRKEYIKNWNKANPNKVKLINKKHRESKTRKLWLEANKLDLRNKARINHTKRRKVDPEYKLLCNLRRRLHHALKGTNKSSRTVGLLGCSVSSLKLYLEDRFTGDMSWDNYGFGWHVDHIRPCSSFDLSVVSEQRECFHFSNLQPLWAVDNLVKGSRLL